MRSEKTERRTVWADVDLCQSKIFCLFFCNRLKHLNLEKNEISAVPQLESKTVNHDSLVKDTVTETDTVTQQSRKTNNAEHKKVEESEEVISADNQQLPKENTADEQVTSTADEPGDTFITINSLLISLIIATSLV